MRFTIPAHIEQLVAENSTTANLGGAAQQ